MKGTQVDAMNSPYREYRDCNTHNIDNTDNTRNTHNTDNIGITDNVEYVDIESAHSPRVTAQVYKFRPTTEFPKLRLLSGRTSTGHVTLKAVVRRESVLIVSDKQGEWWSVSCAG